MRQESIKVGIAGSGFAAKLHYDSYFRIPQVKVEVVALYSKTKENRERFAKERGMIACKSLEELIERVDVVDVCVPGVLHERFTMEALAADRHVILEKPFTGYYGPKEEKDFL